MSEYALRALAERVAALEAGGGRRWRLPLRAECRNTAALQPSPALIRMGGEGDL